MSAAVRNRSPVRRPSHSPHRRHASPRRRSSPRKERSPGHRRSSSMREKSPVRKSASHRSRSPMREKLHNHARSPKDMRDRSPRREREPDNMRVSRRRQSRSPVKEKLPQRTRSPIPVRSRSPARTDDSRSPSPRTKRLRRAKAERENEKQIAGEYTRGSTREKHREQIEDRNALPEGKSAIARSKNGGRSSKSIKHDRSISPSERNRHRRCSPGSPSRSSRDRARDEVNNSKGTERPREYGDDSISKMKAAEEALETKQKQKPSFELSGKLAEETNRVRGVTLLFTEPPDAHKPDIRWRLYVFKAGEVLNEPLYLHRQSSYLFGRERRVADVPTDHPSCSKQHAVIQYRLVEKEQPDGLMKKEIRPYLMDLGSTNGTFINDNRIELQRYYELFEKDTVRFGNSSREYVLLHENSVQ